MMYRIICGDPGRSKDPFGIVGVEYDTMESIIRIKFADRFKDKPFIYVAQQMYPFVQRVNPHYLCLETNNEGKQAIQAFKDAGLVNVLGINTVSNLSGKNWDTKFDSMDKNRTTMVLNDLIKTEKLTFPRYATPEIRELVNELNQIESKITESGKVSYRARSSRHDDLYMALLLCIHVVRHIR